MKHSVGIHDRENMKDIDSMLMSFFNLFMYML